MRVKLSLPLLQKTDTEFLMTRPACISCHNDSLPAHCSGDGKAKGIPGGREDCGTASEGEFFVAREDDT